jgi:hypothetical protein
MYNLTRLDGGKTQVLFTVTGREVGLLKIEQND